MNAQVNNKTVTGKFFDSCNGCNAHIDPGVEFIEIVVGNSYLRFCTVCIDKMLVDLTFARAKISAV